jgi:hypothetical protein
MSKNAATRKKQPPVIDAEFERFWNTYPRCIDRDGTHRAFRRALTVASFAEIMTGLAGYPFSRDPVHQPHPTTWLNQKRWEGYITREPVTVAVPAPPPSRSSWMDHPAPYDLFSVPTSLYVRPDSFPAGTYAGTKIEAILVDDFNSEKR